MSGWVWCMCEGVVCVSGWVWCMCEGVMWPVVHTQR